MTKMIVRNEFSTIRDILKSRASIARFGDGELRMCIGGKIKSQHFDPQLQIRLLDILNSKQEKLFIGIPRAEGRKNYPAKEHWDKFMGRDKISKLFDPKRIYHSSFISRMESAPVLNTKGYWDLVKLILKHKEILVVEGRKRQFSNAAKQTDLFDDALSFHSITAPNVNAFKHCRVLIDKIVRYPKSFVVILSLGATATVLAHDLCKLGYQALDFGRLAMHYKKFFG